MKNKHYYIHEIVTDQSDLSFDQMIEDTNQKEPLTNVIAREKTALEKEMVNDIFESGILSESQKDKLKLYYFENLSLAKIGKRYGVTREAIRQNMKVSIKKIQEAIK